MAFLEKVAGARPARISFMGVWDTVASVIVPRRDRLLPQLLTLPYTRCNPSVEVFRHAMAIDERRRMFRLNRWSEPQPYVANPFATPPQKQLQDIKQVWFAGVHSDIGGGRPEEASGLSKFPLDWIIREAVAHGLKINVAMKNHLVLGRPRAGSPTVFVRPDPLAAIRDSLTWGWRPLEWLPKSVKWKEWPRPGALGFYLPRGEPRMIADGATLPTLHQSVVTRMNAMPGYRPENLPQRFNVEA